MKSILLVALLVFTTSESELHYFFVFLNSKPDKKVLSKEEQDKVMAGHMENINRLAKEGKLIVAGPFEGGGGIFIFKANSLEETKEWVSTDPGVKAERWNIEILPYHSIVGSVCTVREPYEMIMYRFIRYRIGDRYVDTASATAVQLHEGYMKKLAQRGHLITAGGFDQGGILIVKDKEDSVQIQEDPAIRNGYFRAEFKQLYVAKGAFCEN